MSLQLCKISFWSSLTAGLRTFLEASSSASGKAFSAEAFLGVSLSAALDSVEAALEIGCLSAVGIFLWSSAWVSRGVEDSSRESVCEAMAVVRKECLLGSQEW